MSTQRTHREFRSLQARAFVPGLDGGGGWESESSRVRRVALAWEALPEDHDAEVDGDPFDAPAPRTR